MADVFLFRNNCCCCRVLDVGDMKITQMLITRPTHDDDGPHKRVLCSVLVAPPAFRKPT